MSFLNICEIFTVLRLAGCTMELPRVVEILFTFVIQLSCRRCWLCCRCLPQRKMTTMMMCSNLYCFSVLYVSKSFWCTSQCYFSQEAVASVSCSHFTAQLSGGFTDHTQLMFSIPKAPNQCFHNLFTRCMNKVWCLWLGEVLL